MGIKLDRMLERLPHWMASDSGSNISKLLEIAEPELDELEQLFSDIIMIKDVDQATGQNLDALGQNVGELRLGETDEEYRIRIKARIKINKSRGTVEELNDIAALLIGETEFLGFEELFDDPTSPEPAALRLNHYPIPGGVPIDTIEEVASGGVRIEASINSQYYVSGAYIFGQGDSVFTKIS